MRTTAASDSPTANAMPVSMIAIRWSLAQVGAPGSAEPILWITGPRIHGEQNSATSSAGTANRLLRGVSGDITL
jgi:hypothetical protein